MIRKLSKVIVRSLIMNFGKLIDSVTFLTCNFEDEILLRGEDCNDPEFLLIKI